jgi:hypothetical protein
VHLKLSYIDPEVSPHLDILFLESRKRTPPRSI